MNPWEEYKSAEAKPWEEYQPTAHLPWHEDLSRKFKQAGSGILEGAVGLVNLPMEAIRAAGDVSGVDRQYLPLSTNEINQRLQESGITTLPGEDFGSKAIRFTGSVLGGATATPQKAVDVTRQAVDQGIKQLSKSGLSKAGDAGYVFPRSNIKPTWMNQLAERFGGKQAIEHTATIKNQQITNRLAAKALGLPEDTALTPTVLKSVRDEAGKSYETIKSIGILTADDVYNSTIKKLTLRRGLVSGPAEKQIKSLADELLQKNIPAPQAIETVKDLRYLAKANIRSLNPADKALGKAQKQAADALDDLIERNIEPALGKQILSSYKSARQLIAKTHTVEDALNPATGNISAKEIGKLGDKLSLTDELKQIADFSHINPRIAREPVGAPPSGGLFEPLVYGTTGTVLTGPGGMAAAAIPILGKPLARKLAVTIPKEALPRTQNAFFQRGLFGGTAASQNAFQR